LVVVVVDVDVVVEEEAEGSMAGAEGTVGDMITAMAVVVDGIAGKR
jgi:hypothetical protein